MHPSSQYRKLLRAASALCCAGVAAAALQHARPALGQVTSVLRGGPPVQVLPYVSEPGVPSITITPGTPNPFAGADGTGGGGPGGDGTGLGGGAGGDTGGPDPINTLIGTPWGSSAICDAQSLGLNPSALAATCVLESGCTAPAAGSGAQGVFQMFPAAFHDGLNTALAANPALASQVNTTLGPNDPTTAAIAASGYLMQATQNLQFNGISNPTVLDTRSYYNFGPKYGATVATAKDDVPMSQVLNGAPSSFFTKNSITPSETVGQWRASITAKIGNAANQPVLS